MLPQCRPASTFLAVVITALQAAQLRAQQPAQPAAGIAAQIASAVAAYRAPLRRSSVDYGAIQALRNV